MNKIMSFVRLDFYCLKSSLTFIFIFSMIAILSGKLEMIGLSFSIVCFSSILKIISITRDNKINNIFYGTLPIKQSTIVIGRFASLTIITLFFSGLTFILSILFSLDFKTFAITNGNEIFMRVSIAFSAILIIIALHCLVDFIVSSKKLKLINIFSIIIFVIINVWLMTEEFKASLNDIYLLAFFLPLIALTTLAASFFLSLKFYRKKEDSARYKFSEDTKPLEQLKYLFPDKKLLNKYNKFRKLIVFMSSISVIIFGTILFANSLIVEKKSNYEFLGFLLLYGFLGIYLITLIIISLMQGKVMKEQYLLLKEDKNFNALYIRLHELRNPFVKRWNKIIILGFTGAIVSNLIFTFALTEKINKEGFGWIFFFIFIIEIALLFITYFEKMANVRLKMLPIEEEIDLRDKKSNANLN